MHSALVVLEKKNFCPKDIIAQLYFMVGCSNLPRTFPVNSGMTQHMMKIHFLLENLSISDQERDIPVRSVTRTGLSWIVQMVPSDRTVVPLDRTGVPLQIA